jgi:hypothetical protein
VVREVAKVIGYQGIGICTEFIGIIGRWTECCMLLGAAGSLIGFTMKRI